MSRSLDDRRRILAARKRDSTPAPPALATGATAGTPGTFTPPGSRTPANLAEMAGIVASPATAWTTGQHVITGNAAHTFWNGTAWAVGDAAASGE
jgi:hypothetical protein